MGVRVIARVRPLLKSERDVDAIVRLGAPIPIKSRMSQLLGAAQHEGEIAPKEGGDAIVRIPNPKNENEEFSFPFNAVYGAHVSQQELFDAEGPFIIHICVAG